MDSLLGPQTTPPHNLPVRLTSFVGRERELGRVAQLLASHRLITLTGAGGCGKTRLGLESASQAATASPGGVYFVSLAVLADPTLVISTIAVGLAVRETAGQPLVQSVKDAIGERQMLLLVDNFEHLLPAAPLVTDLLAACPKLKVLVTSREALRLDGEQVYPVLPLTLPGVRSPSTLAYDLHPSFTEAEAVRLFAERASSVQPDFRLNSANAEAVGEICTRLDGLPLAIELAAARVRHLSPPAMLRRMEQRLPLMTGGPRDRPARQQTLRDTIAWSFDLLGAPEQRLFRRLAVFVGGCSLSAIEAVCGADDVPHASILDSVARLVDQSLVQQHSGADGDSRFTMLETVREYALEHLQARGETETYRWRHMAYIVRLSEEAWDFLRTPARKMWLARLEDDHENVRAALAWSEIAPGCIEQGLRIAGNLHWFWRLGNHWGEIRAWLKSALLREDAGEPTAPRARALWCLGMQSYFLSDYAAAQAHFEASVEVWRQLEYEGDLALTLSALGLVRRIQGDYAARSIQEEAVAICRRLDDQTRLAQALYFLGSAPGTSDDYLRARTALGEGAAIYRARGDRWAVARFDLMLGIAAHQLGDHDEARGRFEGALSVFRVVDDRWFLARALRGLGQIAWVDGDALGASTMYRDALSLYRELSDRAGVADCLAGVAAIIPCQPDQRVRLLAAADGLREALGLHLDPVNRVEANREVRAARTMLDQTAFAAAWAEGRAMSPEQAIELALAPLEPAGPPNDASDGRPATDLSSPLSRREREVATLVARGLSDRQIAASLVISERTVHGHVASILAKLDFRSRSQVAVWAVHHGLAASAEG
ncbi:MAG TPA: tetratricopeptide repeat protein [Chloroflexota bacterium]|nr:tetratricopeptide repeat protein [Chloroflexota bacterium]